MAIAALFGLLLGRVPAAGQSSGPITESRLRALTRQAQNEARGDATELVLALDRRVRHTWGEFESFPISIVGREDLHVTLATPYMMYRSAIIDRLRTKRPIDRTAWVNSAVITISPSRLGAPDVENVVVLRDGRDIPAAQNLLRRMTFSNGNGDQGILHAGDVLFPASAFGPGATVTVTVQRHDGEPFVYNLSDAELATLK